MGVSALVSRAAAAAAAAVVAGAAVALWPGGADVVMSSVDPSGVVDPVAAGAPAEPAAPPPRAVASAAATSTAHPAAAPSAAPLPTAGPVPYGTVEGLLTFRGNPTRSFYGTGPVPADVAVDWSYPESAMCGPSTVGDETTEWCGSGWTGQPAVAERDGRTWLVFGAYDHAVHFVDADTGEDILPPFPTGDIIKGSVTIDPDGYPIVYTGSRDGRYRAIAVDGDEARELWALTAADATGPTRWNDDWDGAGLVIDDRLVIGGENSRVFVVDLNRGYAPDGSVVVDPEVVWDAAGWDDQLLSDVGDGNVSIESSVAVVGDVVHFANSGGLVQGWDLAPLDTGDEPEQVLRWWMGDDVDATVVADEDGMLYVAAEYERFTARASEVGQVVKLDPSRPDDPVVWSWADPRAEPGRVAGVWGTPALHGDELIVPTTGGTLVGLGRADGDVRWELELGDHLWSSPVVVDDVLVQGDCSGDLHAFDLAAAGPPQPRWQITLGGCVESTPAVWEGRIYVGTRAGRVHAVAGVQG